MTAVGLVLVAGTVVFGLGVGTVAALDVAVTHEHSAHEHQISDVAYDAQHDTVWSIDKGPGEESAVLAGYSVEAAEVVVTEEFDDGHALAVGDGVVYVADGHTLWEFDVASEEATELTAMDVTAGGMAFDGDRGLVWIAGGGEGHVVAYDAENGEEVKRHTAHTPDGLNDISVNGEYVATVATWEPEVVVYDVDKDEVAFEPLPDAIAEDDEGNLVSVHLTESDDLVLGGGWDTVFVYDVATREVRTEYAAHSWGVAAIGYDESADVIVSAGTGNSLAFFDAEADAVLKTYGHDDTIYAADVDTTNGIVWFGDGEDRPGTITGLEMTVEGDDSNGAPANADGGGATDEPDDEAAAVGEDGAGFSIVAGVIAVLSIAAVGARRPT